MEKQKRRCSEEAKARMCLAQQKRFSNPEERIKTGLASKLAYSNPEIKMRQSATMKAKWADPEYRERTVASKRIVSQRQDVKDKISETSKKRWADPEFKQKMSDQRRQMNVDRPEINQRRSEAMKKKHADPEYKIAHTARMQELCSKEEWRRNVGEATKKALNTFETKKKHIDGLIIAKQTSEFHKNMGNAIRKVWRCPDYRKHMSKAIGDGQRRANLDPQVHANRRLGACKAMETRESYGRGWSMSSCSERLIRRFMQLYFPQDGWTHGGRTRTGTDQSGIPVYQPLDCYSSKLRVIIEYDGPLHFYNSHNDKTLRVAPPIKDVLLNSWVVANDWKLIRVSDSCFLSDPKRIIKLIVDSVYHHDGMQYRFGREYEKL